MPFAKTTDPRPSDRSPPQAYSCTSRTGPRREPKEREKVAEILCLRRSQPRPAPRFSRTDPEIGIPPGKLGEHTDEVLTAVGYSTAEIAALRDDDAVS